MLLQIIVIVVFLVLNFFFGDSIGLSLWTGSFAAIVVPTFLLKRIFPEKKRKERREYFHNRL